MENPTLWAFRIPRLWYLQHQLEMQQHQQETDKRIDEVFRRLDEGNAKPKQGVFYNGQIYDAYTFVSDLIKSAKKRIVKHSMTGEIAWTATGAHVEL